MSAHRGERHDLGGRGRIERLAESSGDNADFRIARRRSEVGRDHGENALRAAKCGGQGGGVVPRRTYQFNALGLPRGSLGLVSYDGADFLSGFQQRPCGGAANLTCDSHDGIHMISFPDLGFV